MENNAKSAPILVEAIEPGYYNLRRRKIGAQFYIRSTADIGKWMKVLGEAPPVTEVSEVTSLPEDGPSRGPIGDVDVPPDPPVGVALSTLATQHPQTATGFFGKKPGGKAKDGL